MGSAVLQILGDASGVTRMFGDITAMSRRAAASVAADWRGAGMASLREARATTQAMARLELDKQRAAERAARAREGAEKRVSTVAKAEGHYRQSAHKTEADAAVREAERVRRVREREERAATAASIRAASVRSSLDRQRTREVEEAARRQQRAWARFGGGVARGAGVLGSAGMSFARDAHGQIQDARRTAAMQQQALNTTLLQLVPQGATGGEVAGMRARILQFAQQRRLNRDTVIEAVGGAQSAHNALGGATPQARSAALEQTLRDVDFASVVDPRNPGGLVRLGALLRGQPGVTGGVRDQILRQAAGISFQGSVETDQALRQGLPGLMRTLAANTANVPEAQRGAVTQSTIADFLAQIQTTAASGGRVTVSANRMTNLRTALSNTHTQQRLGEALARRRMTDEQRTEFNEVFTRDRRGRYTMDPAVVNSPSRAAAMFGHMFNNDTVALGNFLGVHGGGGARQLLNRPEATLLGSYFSTGVNAQGQTVRQYDLVNELMRNTITPGQEATMRAAREGEDAKNIEANENARLTALTENTGALGQLSNAFSAFAASNPLGASALGAAGSAAGGLLGGGLGGRAIAGVGRGLASVVAGAGGGIAGIGRVLGGVGAAAIGGLVVGDQINNAVVGSGNGVGRGVGGRGAQGQVTESERMSVFSGSTWRGLAREIRDALVGAPIQVSVDTKTLEHAASRAATRPPPSPPGEV